MQTIQDLTDKPTNLPSSTPSQAPGGDVFDQAQKGLIDWFFIRLMSIYGNRFNTQFANQPQVVAAKLEWGEMICSAGREQLHAKLEHAKRAQYTDEKLSWPNIGYILGIHIGASPTGINSDAYKPYLAALPDCAAKERGRESGESAIAAMRELLS